MNKGNKLKILIVASEAGPYVKSGGLGDVVGSLPKALIALGADVRIVIPKYKSIKQDYFFGDSGDGVGRDKNHISAVDRAGKYEFAENGKNRVWTGIPPDPKKGKLRFKM